MCKIYLETVNINICKYMFYKRKKKSLDHWVAVMRAYMIAGLVDAPTCTLATTGF